MKKIAILYGSTKKLTNAHKPVHNPKQPPYYVRMETVNIEGDLVDSLNEASPQGCETVLNTVHLE